ncbi:glycosyltransferase family 2 protein [Photobacterium sp. GB-36]|uniref:glycosyltransferase family 2 protein n=1 Tax=Photobacterium sp. GB-36 TaxID=2022108 RepID=UPI000D1786D2|nr:glycosyltransferase family 2 protein [Photobacterium sp. GB-36]PSV46994.1 glycosyl transferase [Photobacterium sp. GB-36]
MTDKKPLVSVITPSFNCEKSISSTIESVINQSFIDWEMIIVDDCSTDGSVDVIESFMKKDSRIRLIKRLWNAGPAIARNVAIESAQGRYIAFLDSDDQWFENKLEKQISFMQDQNIELSYTAYNKYDFSGKHLGVYKPKLKVNYSDMLKSNRIGCLTAIYDSEKLGKVYMPNISKRQDLGLWLRILKMVPFAYGMDDILANYLAVQPNSVSSNKITAAKYQWRLYREVEKLPFKLSAKNFLSYAYLGYKKSK